MSIKGWIEVNDLYCKGCELCLCACPQQVLSINIDQFTPKGYHPVHIFREGCTGCGICALMCPEAALIIYREVSKRSPVPAKTAANC